MEVRFSHYGEERDVNATDGELQMFEIVAELSGREPRLTRKSDSYVTAVLGEWDLARFKYSSRAKWIMFPVFERGGTKNRISCPEDVRGFADKIVESVAHIEKYQ